MPPNSVFSICWVWASVEFGKNCFRPGGKLDLDIQRRTIAGETISIAQAGESLVQRVPGRPETVQIEKA